jgi:hypothetical protein
MLPEVYSPRCIIQGVGIHKPRPALGQLALAPFGKRREKVLSRQQFQNGVAKKFQPFIVLDCGWLRGFVPVLGTQLRDCGTVRQSALEKFPPVETITEALLELLCITLSHFLQRSTASDSNPYFGALSCVAPSFLASSALFLHVGCKLPGMEAHLLNAATAASKCEAFSSEIPRT